MNKSFILLTLTSLIFLQSIPAYCAEGSRTISFQVSAYLPEHAMITNNPNALQFSSNAFQLVQTQTVIRDNERINLTSIVVA